MVKTEITYVMVDKPLRSEIKLQAKERKMTMIKYLRMLMEFQKGVMR